MIGKKIEQRLGNEELINILSEKLSGSELNSLLMEVYDRKLKKVTAPELLRQYSHNRFVQPAESNYINLLEKSLATVKIFQSHGFSAQQVSPLSQAGACSVVATVDQGKIVTALRNCEVLSDATNAFALHISHLKKNKTLPAASAGEHIKYCSVQRHVRSQVVNEKGFSPHFTIGCLVSSGMDTGNYAFEKKAFGEHFMALQEVLQTVFNIDSIYFKLEGRKGYHSSGQLITSVVDYLHAECKSLDIREDEQQSDNNYYKGIRFKTIIKIKGREFEIADGGFVDWTQQLLANKKERFLISGFGLELLNKFEEGLM